MTAPIEVPTTVLKVNHHPAAHMATRYMYAGYGSNLSMDQMAARCPRAEIVTSGKIVGYRLAFANFATIVPDENSMVPVGIFSMTATDIETLDRREGLGRSYDRYLITPLTTDGRAIRCFTYIKRDATPCVPSPEYFQRCQTGYRDWSFDDRRLRHARRRAEKDVIAAAVARAEFEKNNPSAAFSHEYYEPVHDSVEPMLPLAGGSHRKSLVTGRDRTARIVIEGKEQTVARYAAANARQVEWGFRDGEHFWRVKGSRAWYRDVSSDADVKSGIARGEIATNLPGSKAFIPKDGKPN